MRWLYSLLWCLVLPIALLRLWWRGRMEPGYRQHVAERLGWYDNDGEDSGMPTIWLHAVSAGETRAAQPLIDALLQEYPAHRIVLTHMTATGRAAGLALFGKYGRRVRQAYLPYDMGWSMRRFLRRFTPCLAILMETEVWPNLVAQCRRLRIPLVLANARLSERSLAKAQRGLVAGLFRQAAQGLTCVAAQTEQDAQRIRQLGAPAIQVTGSIKFDVTPPAQLLALGAAWRGQFGVRPVLLCAATREGEEALILDALPSASLPFDVLMILVPRHPQRFDEVAHMIEQRGIAMQRRSQMAQAPLPASVRIVLGDSMGEMFAYYAAADLAFIGGSLLPLGGQTLIESCAVGTPVLLGPHTFNFFDASNDAIAAGAALRVQDAATMLDQAGRFLRMPAECEQMGGKAREFAAAHRGATSRMMTLLRPFLGSGKIES